MTGAPGVGDLAPDASLLDQNGAPVSLASHWRDRPAVLVFLRYFGCPFCQMHVVALREEQGRFRDAGAGVVLIGQGSAAEGARFRDEKRIPFTCLLDPARASFEAYGLGRGTIPQVFGPRVALPFLAANAHTETLQRGLRGGSMMQMPGTFVVDTASFIRLAHRNRTIADSPRNAVILEALAGLRAGATEANPS
jgi:peroxiredoxin